MTDLVGSPVEAVPLGAELQPKQEQLWCDTGKNCPVGFAVGLRGSRGQGKIGGSRAPSLGPKFGK